MSENTKMESKKRLKRIKRAVKSKSKRGRKPSETIRVPHGLMRLEPTRLTPRELRQLCLHLRGRKFNEKILTKALKKHGMRLFKPKHGKPLEYECGTPYAKLIYNASQSPAIPAQVKADLEALMDIDPAYTVSTYDTPNFHIRYTTDAGSDQIRDPTVDTGGSVTLYNQPGVVIGNMTAGDGIPNYVEQIGIILEYALAQFISPTYGFPNPAAGGRIPVTLEDLAGVLGYAYPTPSIRLSRNLTDYYLNDTPIHELFHLIQFLYLFTGNFDEWYEGTARLIPNTVNDLVNRWMSSAYANYANNPNQSLTALGYDAAAFWEYVMEQRTYQTSPADEPYVGIDAIRSCWQAGQNAGTLGMNVLAQAIEALPLRSRFSDFWTSWPNRTDLHNNELTFGNWLIANFVKDLANTGPDRRFDYIEDEELPTMRSVFTTSRNLTTTAAVNLQGQSVNPWAARYYVINIGAGVQTIQLDFSAMSGGGLTDCLLQVVLVDNANNIVDIIKSKSLNYQRIIGNPTGNLKQLVAIVAGLSTGGTFDLQANSVGAAPDIMITRWNTEAGREYQKNPMDQAYDWDSPDIWVDNDDDGAEDQAYKEYQNSLGGSNHLYVRVRNKGTADAIGVLVRLYYQDASAGLRDDSWQAVMDKSPSDPTATQQSLTLDIPANSTASGFVNWYVPSSASTHFCIKAELVYAADGSVDNNVALNNFGVEKLLFRPIKVRLKLFNPHDIRRIAKVVPEFSFIDPRFIKPPKGINMNWIPIDSRNTRTVEFRIEIPALVKELRRNPIGAFRPQYTRMGEDMHFTSNEKALSFLHGRTITFNQTLDGLVVGGYSIKLMLAVNRAESKKRSLTRRNRK